MLKDILSAFIPLFVAVDAIGVLPIYASLTEGVNASNKKSIIYQSMLTALCLAVGFIFLGNAVFSFLNITIGDFMVAGGTLLFCMALVDILNPTKSRRRPQEMGIVPLGTPLITGPAVLTTSLIVMGEYGLIPTLISVLANILIAGMVFSSSDLLLRSIGTAGSRALSKVTSLLLAAIAVMMVRKGIFYIIRL
jgi:multiple antibiotic resistance protein